MWDQQSPIISFLFPFLAVDLVVCLVASLTKVDIHCFRKALSKLKGWLGCCIHGLPGEGLLLCYNLFLWAVLLYLQLEFYSVDQSFEMLKPPFLTVCAKIAYDFPTCFCVFGSGVFFFFGLTADGVSMCFLSSHLVFPPSLFCSTLQCLQTHISQFSCLSSLRGEQLIINNTRICTTLGPKAISVRLQGGLHGCTFCFQAFVKNQTFLFAFW